MPFARQRQEESNGLGAMAPRGSTPMRATPARHRPTTQSRVKSDKFADRVSLGSSVEWARDSCARCSSLRPGLPSAGDVSPRTLLLLHRSRPDDTPHVHGSLAGERSLTPAHHRLHLGLRKGPHPDEHEASEGADGKGCEKCCGDGDQAISEAERACVNDPEHDVEKPEGCRRISNALVHVFPNGTCPSAGSVRPRVADARQVARHRLQWLPTPEDDNEQADDLMWGREVRHQHARSCLLVDDNADETQELQKHPARLQDTVAGEPDWFAADSSVRLPQRPRPQNAKGQQAPP
eukprot:CAMPEP_0170379396 /NCGR_PEP_ID=MMETSP0117_2-20130122/13321_1 /TAXON_ID=400756 /ORGANISM="Durinskia baltica, Strain CSIRO CS-38" /LENGTH=292 /DNA_ID=CAMNT_0010634833 /DNA_START=83 /DNA_END=958 /DNA_ORIENTATION=-